MRNRIITFIFLIPFMLILLLFGVSKALGNSFEVPVRGIEILNDTKQKENRILDIDKKDTFDLFVNVIPRNAKNKKIHVEVINDNVKNNVTYEMYDIKGGKRLKFKGSGRVTIKCKTDEGGHTRHMSLRIVHSKIYDITPKMYTNEAFESNKESDIDIVEGTINLEVSNKKYNLVCETNPSTLNHLPVEWESSNPDVLEVNKYSGEAKTHFSGECFITANLRDKIKKLKIKVNEPSDVRVNGETRTNQETQSNIIYVENAEASQIEGAVIEKSVSSKQHIIKHVDHFKVKGIEYNISKKPSHTCIASNMQKGEKIYHKKNTTMRYHINSSDSISDIEYEYDGKTYKTETVSVDIAEKNKTIKARYKVCGETKTIKADIIAINNISTISHSSEGVEWGADKVKTYGNKEFNENEEKPSKIKTGFIVLNEKYDEIPGALKDLEYTKYGDFTIEENEITTNGLGKQSITAIWKYKKYFPVEESIYEFNVIDGVNVRTPSDLTKANKKDKAIAVQNDIFVEGEDFTKNEMYTTYDWKFYKNKGESRPKIRYIYEFKNDVYGNGYQINAHNITTNKATAFKTFPSLVEAGRKGLGLDLTASVKGQDNICFLVREDNITINNIVLKSCKDEALIEKDKLNQKRLENKGTVLEIMGDNVKLLKSRVSNGRICIRIFGRDLNQGDANFTPTVQADEDYNTELEEKKMSTVNVASEKINVTIAGCVISNSREFLIKIGSNRGVLGKDKGETDVEPYKFSKEDGTKYKYNNKSEFDDYFKNKYVITRVEMEDNELRNSGLFCIGMDTHFAGKLMWKAQKSGAGTIVEDAWRGMAATSYPSELNIKGYLKMYNWVRLKDLNSDSLIETSGSLKGLDFLKLDFERMIYNVVEKRHIRNIVYKNNYVNAGIAFFGGGQNYSFLNEDADEIKNYTEKLFVNLTDAKGKDSITKLIAKEMPVAAGEADFMFYIYKTDNVKGERGYHWQHG